MLKRIMQHLLEGMNCNFQLIPENFNMLPRLLKGTTSTQISENGKPAIPKWRGFGQRRRNSKDYELGQVLVRDHSADRGGSSEKEVFYTSTSSNNSAAAAKRVNFSNQGADSSNGPPKPPPKVKSAI